MIKMREETETIKDCYNWKTTAVLQIDVVAVVAWENPKYAIHLCMEHFFYSDDFVSMHF